MEQVKKVIRVNENPMKIEAEVKGGDDERSENEISDMDKLPSEILMKILDYLDEEELVKCRLLSCRWNEISCRLLQEKTKNNLNSKLVVQIKKYIKWEIVKGKSLDDFLKCFSPSEAEIACGRLRPFPFSCFKIRDLSNMNVTEIREFLSTFGHHMKCVVVDMRREDVANFKRLWQLLLNFAPTIEFLKIISYSRLKDVKLMDPISELIGKTDPINFKQINPTDSLLKKLKVLEITSPYFGQFNGLVKGLLASAPNIQQVSCNHPDFCHNHGLKQLKVWQQLDRVDLLKKLELINSVLDRFQSYEPPAKLMKNLQLEHLRADCAVSPDSINNKKATIIYIYPAIKSSQDTLKNLDLYNLTLESMNFCFRDISSLPNVRQLKLEIYDAVETGRVLHRFSQLCQNTTNLHLDHLYHDFVNVARVIWTEFKGLKSLKFQLTMSDKEDLLAVDSAFSGYSQESIMKIQAKLQEGISMEEARGGETQNPSILDLKGLSRLELDVFIAETNSELKITENSMFVKVLPRHIRENPRSILYHCDLDQECHVFVANSE